MGLGAAGAAIAGGLASGLVGVAGSALMGGKAGQGSAQAQQVLSQQRNDLMPYTQGGLPALQAQPGSARAERPGRSYGGNGELPAVAGVSI